MIEEFIQNIARENFSSTFMCQTCSKRTTLENLFTMRGFSWQRKKKFWFSPVHYHKEKKRKKEKRIFFNRKEFHFPRERHDLGAQQYRIPLPEMKIFSNIAPSPFLKSKPQKPSRIETVSLGMFYVFLRFLPFLSLLLA